MHSTRWCRAVRRKRPLWLISQHKGPFASFPLHPQEQTCSASGNVYLEPTADGSEARNAEWARRSPPFFDLNEVDVAEAEPESIGSTIR